MSENGEQVKRHVESIHRDANNHVQEQLELQELRATSWAANEQAKMNAREAEVKNAALTESQLYHRNLSELQQQARNRENALREELRTQTELICELREKMETSSRGNFESAPFLGNLRTILPGPMASNELPLRAPFQGAQRSATNNSGDP